MNRKDRILEKLRELGSEGPKRSLGQNFLISDVVIERILSAAAREPFPALVEVGPGLGALTDDLIALAARSSTPFTVVELDRKFAEAWRSRGDLRVVEADALRLDWRGLELPDGSLFVSNLPYQISSSLVIERSIEPAGVARMVLMFQKEVAQRIAARAGSKDYGLLTVIAQAFWETSTVSEAGPRDFFPPPNVASRVLHFRRRPTPWLSESGVTAPGFLTFVKAAFAHRRKLLARNLQAWGGGDLAAIEAALAGLSLARTARAEELDPETFVRLYLALRGRNGG